MRKDEGRGARGGKRQEMEERKRGRLGRQQRSVRGLGNSYILSPLLILSFSSFSCSPSPAVKAQYLRHCNYGYGRDERSQLLAEEKEVTE